jgi:hypothetical protein
MIRQDKTKELTKINHEKNRRNQYPLSRELHHFSFRKVNRPWRADPWLTTTLDVRLENGRVEPRTIAEGVHR